MLEYEDFFNLVWGYYINESDVSFDYRERNQDFIRMLTFSAYQKYQKNNVHESIFGEMIKLFFTNLFLFSAENKDTGEIRDWNKED